MSIVAAVAAVLSALIALIVWATSEAERRSTLRRLERFVSVSKEISDPRARMSIDKSAREMAYVVSVRARVPAFMTLTLAAVLLAAGTVIALAFVVVGRATHNLADGERDIVMWIFTATYFLTWITLAIRWHSRSRWYIREYKATSGDFPPDLMNGHPLMLPWDREAMEWLREARAARKEGTSE